MKTKSLFVTRSVVLLRRSVSTTYTTLLAPPSSLIFSSTHTQGQRDRGEYGDIPIHTNLYQYVFCTMKQSHSPALNHTMNKMLYHRSDPQIT
jgi:hypothetical protein